MVEIAAASRGWPVRQNFEKIAVGAEIEQGDGRRAGSGPSGRRERK